VHLIISRQMSFRLYLLSAATFGARSFLCPSHV